MSIRQQVEAGIEERLGEVLRKAHETNYETLYVSRDGQMWWSEEVSADTRIIDNEAETFAAVPSLIQVGTGSTPCNCDWCISGHQDDMGDMDDIGAVNAEYQDRMSRALGAISPGYFRDENYQERINATQTLEELRSELLRIQAELEPGPHDLGNRLAEAVDLTSLPLFGGEAPADTSGVYSWDATSLLYGYGSEWNIEARTH